MSRTLPPNQASTTASTYRPRRQIGRKPLLVVFAALAASFVAAPSVRAAADYNLTLLAPTPIPSGALVIGDNGSERFIVLETNPARFSVFDPAKQQMLFTKTLPYSLKAGKSLAWTWDADHRGLFIVGYPDDAKAASLLDPVLFHVTVNGDASPSVPLKAFQNGVAVNGISYYAPANRIYVVGQATDPLAFGGTYVVQVNEVDPATGTSTWPSGAQLVPSCQKLVSTNRPAAIVRNPQTNRLYIGCGTGSFVYVPEPGVPAVVAIDIANPASPSFAYHPIAGGYNQGESISDDEGGKFVMVAQGSGAPVQAAWIFDELHGTVSGVVSAGDLNIHYASVDRLTGRMFLGIDGGILVGSTRLLKTPQAIKIPVGVVDQGGAGTVLLPGSGYMLVTEKRAISDPIPQVWLYKAKLPTFPPPAPNDPDSSTIDALETPNVVTANFNGSGQGYGVRGFTIGGVNGAAQNVVQSPDDWWAKVQGLIQIPSFEAGPANTPPISQNINDGNRQMYFARVNRAFVSQGEASALSIKADRDPTTEADYNTVTSPDQRANPDAPSQTRQDWPYKAAACSDHGDGAPDGEADGATAKCDQAKGRVDTGVRFDQSQGVPGAMAFGHALGSAVLTRTVGDGLRVTSSAEAGDVQIGVVRIGKIISTSTAKAGGRRGTTSAEYTRSFENVTMPGYSCTTDCDPEEVVANMNRVLGSKILAELPAYTLAATPRGAAASVQREAWAHQQDVVVNDQPETERQIAALRVTYLNDNSARSRAVFEFAATEADANYNLFRLDRGGFGPTDPESPVEPGFLSITPGGLTVPPFDSTPNIGRTARTGAKGAGSLLHQLGHGLQVLLMGRHKTLLSIALWALLLTPLFFAARRRYLLRLMGEV
jgi:hypothetical protein